MELADLTQDYRALSARRALTELVICKAISAPGELAGYVRARLRHSPHFDLVQKAVVGGLVTTTDGVDGLQPLKAAWADALRRKTIIGRLPVRYVPSATAITVVGPDDPPGFVAESAPIPVFRPSLTDASLTPGKIAEIVSYATELLRATRGRVAQMVERDLTLRAAIGEDSALLDAQAGVIGGRPASVLAGQTALGGGSPSEIEEDIRLLLAEVRDGYAVAPAFVGAPSAARYLATLRNSDGARVFPDAEAYGGSLLGVPLLVTAGAPAGILVLIDGDSLLVVDDDLELDTSTQGAFQFETEPTSGAASSVSLWQTNSVGLKLQRFISWRLAWPDGAAFIGLPTNSPA